ncbi:MAG TPA: carboxypeptidase-like regulatory domain-containing protein [Longimicrobium sp.]|nr:carboxypeptidase-like regulatory domain-containing protein [Longimicrobium sp.]
MRLPRFVGALLAMVLVVSCTNPVCGCLTQPTAVLYGRVTDPAGAGVAGAEVLAEQAFGPCGSATPDRGVVGYGRTGADGRYRLVMDGGTSGLDDCQRAYARRPPQSRLRDSDTVAFSVRFRHEPPMDSARVDLVMRAP